MNTLVEDQWVWVIVQEPGEKEQFLGQHDGQENISFIPAFHSKEAAQQCFMDMPRAKGRKYEVQAILFEELSKDAAAGDFMIFLLNENGEVLERIKPGASEQEKEKSVTTKAQKKKSTKF